MKRTLALLCSAVVAISVAPVARATNAPSDSNSSVAASVSAPAEVSLSTETRKKACTYMCAQSKLPVVDQRAYFVNGNTGLLSFNNSGISLQNLDTKAVSTASYPTGVNTSTLSFAQSFDGDEIYYSGLHTPSDTLRFYRLNTVTLASTNVTPSSPTYSLEYIYARGLAVAPDNSGFYVNVGGGGNQHVCRYSATGVEMACSEGFAGSSQVSPVYTNADGSLVYVFGNTNKRFTFLPSSGMSMSTETLAELTGRTVNFDIGAQSITGDVFFADGIYGTTPSTTRIYQLPMSGTDTYAADIIGTVIMHDAVAPRDAAQFVYFLGGINGKSGSFLYEIEDATFGGPLRVRKSLRIKQDRNFYAPSYLAIDTLNRYVVAHGQSQSVVVPVGDDGSVDIRTEGTFNQCPSVNYDITWDYINLAPGKPVKSFLIKVKPMSGGPYQTVATVPATGVREYNYTYTGTDVYLAVFPKGVRRYTYDSVSVYGSAPGIMPRGHQPRC